MKARKLKQILNNTDYTVAFYDEYIGIGSPLCHDLIKLDIATKRIRYALDSYNKEGRKALERKSELLFIWDKLHELVASGEIDEIINGNDVIEYELPVYTVRKGILISTTTDAYGWPNVTIDGHMMYDNTYFKTMAEAIQYGVEDYEYRISHLTERVSELRSEADKLELAIQDSSNIINTLKLLTPAKGSGQL